MKRIFIMTLLLLISCRLTAQTEIKFDLKSQKERLITYKALNNKGLLILTQRKVRGMIYTMMMRMVNPEGKLLWEKELPNHLLSKGYTLKVDIQFDDTFIYVFTSNPTPDDDEYVSKITYDGEIKTEEIGSGLSFLENYGISPQGSFVIENKQKGNKDSGIKKFIHPINPSTLKVEPAISADLPGLEDGQWNLQYYGDGGYYFNAFKKGYNEDHSMNCEFRQLGADGKILHTIDLKAFADHVKYPVPRIKYDGDITPPYGEIYVDQLRKEIYLHGFYQTKIGDFHTGLGSAKLIPEGYYICKYGFDGTLKWNKTYSIPELIKMGCSLRENPQLNEWKYVYFTVEKDGHLFISISADYDPNNNGIIADSTGNFVAIAKGPFLRTGEDYMAERITSLNGDYHFTRSRLFWDLKNSDKINSVTLKASSLVKQKNGGTITNTEVDAFSFDKSTLVIQMRLDTGQLIVYCVAN